jgi:hypothetical protein
VAVVAATAALIKASGVTVFNRGDLDLTDDRQNLDFLRLRIVYA